MVPPARSCTGTNGNKMFKKQTGKNQPGFENRYQVLSGTKSYALFVDTAHKFIPCNVKKS